jgi:ribosomal protein S18 acetylase RimI-like enzyme
MNNRENSVSIRPIDHRDLDFVLEVYRQCEDFLALGPEPCASMGMVYRDIQLSKDEDGIYCGVFDYQDRLIGVVDFILSQKGNPGHAFISLLMIALTYRRKGVGSEVIRLVEYEISKDPQITSIDSAVQINNLDAIRFWEKHGYQIVSEPVSQPDQTTVYHLRKKIR